MLEALDDTERALAECARAVAGAPCVQLVPRLRTAWKAGERAKGWKKLAEEWRKDGLNKGESAAVADRDGFIAAVLAFRCAAEPFLELDPELLELVRG